MSKHYLKKVYLCLFIMSLFLTSNAQDSLWNLFKNESQIVQKTVLLEKIFEKYKYQNNSIADSTARIIINLGLYSKSDSLQAVGNYLLAISKLIQAQYDSCQYYIEKSRVDLQAIENSKTLNAYLHKLKGLLHYYKGEYKSGLEENFIALEIWKSKGDQEEQSKIYNNIGICYERLHEYDNAINFYQKGLDLISLDNKKSRAIFMNNIAIILINNKQFDEAEKLLSDAKQNANAIDDQLLLLDISGSLSEIYFSQKQYNKGILLSKEIIEISKQRGDHARVVRNLNMLGAQYNYLDKAKTGIPYLEEALLLSSEYSIGEHRMEIFENLMHAYKQTKNYPKLATTQDSFIVNSQQRFNKEKQLITEELNIKYESEKKDRNLLFSEQGLSQRTLQRNVLIVGILGLLTLIYLLRRSTKQKQEMNKQKLFIQEQKVKQMEEKQKTLSLASILEGQEVERNRIAQDLHDGLGGLLASVKNHFSLIQDEIKKLENLRIYDRTNNMIDQACSEVRRISHNLMPMGLKIHGLNKTIQEVCINLQAEHKIPIKFELIGNAENRLPESLEIFVFRIIQESLHNCMKHAQASHVLVQLGYYENELQLLIEDDGIGFDISAVHEGIGLHSIKSRVQFLDGTIDIDSRLGFGTTTSINLPIDEK